MGSAWVWSTGPARCRWGGERDGDGDGGSMSVDDRAAMMGAAWAQSTERGNKGKSE